MKKIGILGGTFDPIHEAHLKIGELAMERFGLERVLFMPTGESYFKTRVGRKVASATDRLAMVRLALEDYPGFEASDLEVRREGHTYTVETLEELTAADPDAEFYFIIGADTLSSIEKWYLVETIFSLAKVIVANRDDEFPDSQVDAMISRLKQLYAATIYRLDCKSIRLSSSDIRRSLEDGRIDRTGLPLKVYRYIVEHGLYSEAGLDAGE